MTKFKDNPEPKLDKDKIKPVSWEDDPDKAAEYWRNTTIKEGLQEVERLRRLAYGDRATGRIQKDH